MYDHKQYGYFHWLIFAIAAVMFAVAFGVIEDEPGARIGFLIGGVICFLVGWMFQYLRVVDGGDCLIVRFGPLPLLGTRIPYAKIKAAQADKTTIIDGWGVHWIPGRGIVYNIWGFDCVRLQVNGRVIRIGTDDVQGLLRFLRMRLGDQIVK